MSTLNAFLISTLAGMSTIIGSLVIFLKIENKNTNRFISFCLSFSISIMIGISITELIPSSYFNIMLNYKGIIGILIILFSFIMGMIMVTFTNKIINNNNTLYKLGILSMIALILHNFPEGIATFMGSIKNPTLGLKLSFAIMFHNIPEGISIAVPIYYATNSKKKALYYAFLSGIAEPLGAFITYILLNRYVTDLMLCATLLFVAGIMITLSINEMLPKALAYKENKFIYLGLIIGIILILINHLMF